MREEKREFLEEQVDNLKRLNDNQKKIIETLLQTKEAKNKRLQSMINDLTKEVYKG